MAQRCDTAADLDRIERYPAEVRRTVHLVPGLRRCALIERLARRRTWTNRPARCAVVAIPLPDGAMRDGTASPPAPVQPLHRLRRPAGDHLAGQPTAQQLL